MKIFVCCDCLHEFDKTGSYQKRCRECGVQHDRARDRDCTRLRQTKETRVQIKREVLAHYGPSHALRCSWPDCHISDVDMLSLDHINNDGAKDRATHPGPSQNFYIKLRHAEYPDGFQTLCWNHQWKKEILRRRNNGTGE